MRRWLVIAIAAIAPRAARASGVVEELAAGTTPATAASPGSYWISDTLAGMLDLDRWQLRLDLSSNRSYSGAAGDAGGGATYSGALSAVRSLGDRGSLQLNGSWQPPSTQRVTSRMDRAGLFGGTSAVDVLLSGAPSSLSVGAGISYGGTVNADHELNASLTLGATRFHADQEVTGVRDPGAMAGQPLGASEAVMRCQTTACSADLIELLQARPVDLWAFALGASVIDTFETDTDVSVDGTYFMYDHDPMEIGRFYAPMTVATTTRGRASGAPLLRNALGANLTQREGAAAVTAGLTYADYIDGGAFDLGANLRLQYQLELSDTRRLELHATLGGGSHVDPKLDPTLTFSVGLGTQYTW